MYGWDPYGVLDGIVGESRVAIVIGRVGLHIEGFVGVAGNLSRLGRWRYVARAGVSGGPPRHKVDR
jgi:hypothetical protein